jgi:hypothetical protein
MRIPMERGLTVKHVMWLYAIACFLSSSTLWAQAGQSQQGLEISVLGLRRQKSWSFSDGKPDPSTFLKGEKRTQPENEGWIVTNYEGTIEPNGLKLKWSQGEASGTHEFEFVRVGDSSAPHSSALRFDGLYRCQLKSKDDPRPLYEYLRFFQDGTVRIVTTRMDLDASWEYLSHGVTFAYKTENSRLRFVEAWRLPQAESQQKPLFSAAPGYDMVVLLLRVKTLQAKASLDFSHLQVEDAQGNTYKCALEASSICGEGVEGAEENCGVPFSVPERTRVSKLRYGETAFDLQRLESNAEVPR